MENISSLSFLIVDDVRTTRIAMYNMFKAAGGPKVHNAENGLEAIGVLLDQQKTVDLIIADFNMPIMHGLMMVKMIRCGHGKIRRDIPIIMMTKHGDSDLYGIAMDLDVNGFLLKPTNKHMVLERIENILNLEKQDEPWLRSSEYYSHVDTDSMTLSLLERKVIDMKMNAPQATQKAIEDHRHQERIKKATRLQRAIDDLKIEFVSSKPQKQEPKEPSVRMKKYHIDNVPVNMVLAKDIYGHSNRKLLAKQSVLTKSMLSRLDDLHTVGEPVSEVWVQV